MLTTKLRHTHSLKIFGHPELIGLIIFFYVATPKPLCYATHGDVMWRVSMNIFTLQIQRSHNLVTFVLLNTALDLTFKAVKAVTF